MIIRPESNQVGDLDPNRQVAVQGISDIDSGPLT
jgi:hypothetical protein